MAGEFLIFCENDLIGSSDLECRDSGLGTASGEFYPIEKYEKHRHVFKIFANAHDDSGTQDAVAIADYYRARDKLTLVVKSASGDVVESSTVHIVDFAEETDDECWVDVYLADRSFFI